MVLKCLPELVEEIWGNESLARVYNSSGKIGEVWLCSNYHGHETRLIDKYDREFKWSDVNKQWGVERFPFLVKHIHSASWLSVQVHPNNKFAQEVGEPWGKPEMWYFIKGGKIINGLNPGALERLKSGDRDWESLLHFTTVKAGEAMYISPGTVHAMGPGIEVYEFQLTSDMTYRFYDWGRKRKIHFEEALKVAREIIAEPFVLEKFSSPYFTVRMTKVDNILNTKKNVVYLAETGEFAGERFDVPTAFVSINNEELRIKGRVFEMEVSC